RRDASGVLGVGRRCGHRAADRAADAQEDRATGVRGGRTLMPLAGMVVVSIDQAVAAPLAARHLADLGARVIKIERPDGGDFARGYDAAVRRDASHFVWLNRGQQPVADDLN